MRPGRRAGPAGEGDLLRADLALVPSLDQLAKDSGTLANLPRHTLVDLLRAARTLVIEVEYHLAIRPPEAATGALQDGASPDRRLSPEEAAAFLGVTRRWLRGHDVPGRIELGHRSVVYSRKALERFLKNRTTRERALLPSV